MVCVCACVWQRCSWLTSSSSSSSSLVGSGGGLVGAGLWKNGSSEFTPSARSDGLRGRGRTNKKRTKTDTESRGCMITLNHPDNAIRVMGWVAIGLGVVGGVC